MLQQQINENKFVFVISKYKFQLCEIKFIALAYSFHLGSDKNKSKLAKKVAKENVSGTTSLANNAIQNAKDLSDVNKHIQKNLNKLELNITIIKLEMIEKQISTLQKYVNPKMIQLVKL